ncbi:MAG: ABC transporter substrate-binding protein [Desulfobacterota bacterium]|nr:ABC transporter substrate-binding protein [Thermodesulfobacteriota bacterium]
MYESAIGTTEDGTLDPLRTFQMVYVTLQHQIFETLVTIDFNTQRIVPVLAERWEQRDSLTIRFYLRRGVRFHNAEPFTAEAVVFTLNLMRDPRNKFGGRFLFDAIAAVQIVDPYTVDIILSAPDALLLRKLAAVGFIFPPKYYTSVGDGYFTRYPIGTGPFRFFYNTKNKNNIREIHLVANEDYWGDRPAIQELIYEFIPPDAHGQALRSGMIDMVITQDTRLKNELANDPKLTAFVQPSLRSAVCLINIDKQSPLQDIRVRRALEHCIDRTKIITTILHGNGIPLYTIAPQGSLAHSRNKPLYPESIKRARELLAESGYAHGLALKAMAADNAPSKALAHALAEQLSHVGVDLSLEFLSREGIKKEVVEPKLMGNNKPSSYDLWIINGWPDLFGASAHFYFLFFHPHGIFNFGIYLDKTSPFEQYYNRALASPNETALAKRLQQLDRLIMTEAVAIPIYQVALTYGMNKRIRFQPGLNDLPLRFKECSIE